MAQTLQTFVILPKEKTTVWVEQNGNFFQQNGSVIKIDKTEHAQQNPLKLPE
jgi:hypothetical protein